MHVQSFSFASQSNPIAFLPSSLPSPSSLIELPNAPVEFWRCKTNLPGSTNHNFLLLIFASAELKLEKIGPVFQLSIHVTLAIRSNRRQKQFQCINIVPNNKFGPVFFFNSNYEKTLFSFLLRLQRVWYSLFKECTVCLSANMAVTFRS